MFYVSRMINIPVHDKKLMGPIEEPNSLCVSLLPPLSRRHGNLPYGPFLHLRHDVGQEHVRPRLVKYRSEQRAVARHYGVRLDVVQMVIGITGRLHIVDQAADDVERRKFARSRIAIRCCLAILFCKMAKQRDDSCSLCMTATC
jgi:hypothetical protein